MSKQKKQYDTQKLFLQGLIAFGYFFSGVTWERTPRTKKQLRGRKSFKAQCTARRLQRSLQS